jgi:hypothetical protein
MDEQTAYQDAGLLFDLEFDGEKRANYLAGKKPKELASIFSTDMVTASTLRNALQPGVYSVVTDPKMKIDEMAATLGKPKKTVYNFRSALFRTGNCEPPILEEEQVLREIACNPNTYHNVAKKIGKKPLNIEKTMFELKDKGLVKSKKIKGLGVSVEYFRDIAGQSVIYKTGEQAYVGIFLAKKIPRSVPCRMKKSIVINMKKLLQDMPAAYDIVRGYIDEMSRHDSNNHSSRAD